MQEEPRHRRERPRRGEASAACRRQVEAPAVTLDRDLGDVGRRGHAHREGAAGVEGRAGHGDLGDGRRRCGRNDHVGQRGLGWGDDGCRRGRRGGRQRARRERRGGSFVQAEREPEKDEDDVDHRHGGLRYGQPQTQAPMTEAWLRRAIESKRAGVPLDAGTWGRIVAGFTAGSIDEAPVAALLMAAAIRGLDAEETLALTSAMIATGETLQFGCPTVDKHSSGGVGDTVSLVVVPLVAACGVAVAKLSGRALGHTGGTIEKLEAIPGVRTGLTPEEFRAQVERIGCAIAAQSERLVPADKKLYALRDRTGTVASQGLIAASIVSKKIAGGADGIVFDVKAGGGAFMRTERDARDLAERLVALAQGFGRRAAALVTAMDEPLGAAVGTELEAIAARDLLAGRLRDPRLLAVSELVAAEMLRLGGIAEGDALHRVRTALEDGSAYERFVALVEAQGGTRAALEALAPARERVAVVAPRGGIVRAIDATAVGEAARELGARHGPRAGVVVRADRGSAVRTGEVLAEIVGATDDAFALATAFTIEAGTAQPPAPVLLARVRDASPGPSKRVVE